MNYLKKIFFLSVCLAGVLVASPLRGGEGPLPVPQDVPWKEYISYEGRFRLLTPGPLSARVDSIKTPIGQVGYHTFLYQPPEEERPQNLIYMVSYCDYPGAAVHSDSTGLLADFFQSTIEAATESVQGELVYSDEIRMEGFPGRLWRIDYLQGQAVIKTQAYLVKNRYYSVQTITVTELAINPSSEKFFSSFRFFPPEGGPR